MTRPEVWVVDDVPFPKCGTVSARATGTTAARGARGRELPSRGQRARGRRHRLPARGLAGG
ncbi:hypothetical protein [Streptomyces sp. NBC_01176]|uniref:hypothetical protein n=1 Tax=Streptomyces sp. NBC_01176 TaxID=2903760 RepID=UPI00386B9DFC